MESDSCDEFTNKSILLLEMKLLEIVLQSVRIENSILSNEWVGIEVENMVREFNSLMC